MKKQLQIALAMLITALGSACTLGHNPLPVQSATVGDNRGARIKALKDERAGLQARIRQINAEITNLRKQRIEILPSAPREIAKDNSTPMIHANSGKPAEVLNQDTQTKLLETNRKIRDRKTASNRDQDQQEIEAAKKDFE